MRMFADTVAPAEATAVSAEIVMVGLLVQVSTATMPWSRACAIEQSLLILGTARHAET